MPQDEKSIIRSLFKPSIGLDDLILKDIYTGTSEETPKDLKNGGVNRQYQKDIGVDYPFIAINAYVFKTGEILDFELDANDFIPKVYLKVGLFDSAAFKSQTFPKDGDILSLFIRAKDNAFKPIRNDYLITNVRAGKGLNEGRGSTIEFFGELFVPHMQDEIVKSFEGTSFEVLQKILQLGFATNETTTSDTQKWICGGDTYSNFLQYITKHSWKDDKSFYQCYIDVYYHLNFVNVNNQVDGDGKIDAAILDSTLMKDIVSDQKVEEGSKKKVPKMLSDMTNFSGTNMFIRTYEVHNNSSAISKKWGYKSYIQFFDQKSNKTWEIFVDPLVSEGSEKQKILLKGRPFPKAADGKAQEEYWKTQNKYFWRGIQYRDVHDKYMFSELWNERNAEELEKMYMTADIERWNPNIYRGEKIPIILHTMSDPAKRMKDGTPDDKKVPANQTPAVMDQFYSGYYMVDGLTWQYSMFTENTDYQPNASAKPPQPSGFIQVVKLTRREWPVPGGPPGQSA